MHPRTALRALAALATLVVTASVGCRFDSTPRELTGEHRRAIETVHTSNGWAQPASIALSDRVVLLKYELPGRAYRIRQLAEPRLLAVRDALQPFGFTRFRVNIHGSLTGEAPSEFLGSSRWPGPDGVDWRGPKESDD